jgi:hypothetical protein
MIEDSLKSEVFKENFLYGIAQKPFEEKITKTTEKAPVLIYKRKIKDFLTGKYIWYSWKPDSLVNYIKINWSLFNITMDHKLSKRIWRKCHKNEDSYKEKYQKINDSIIAFIGKPTNSNIIQDNENYYSQETTWINDNRLVKLYIGFNRNAKKPAKNNVTYYGYNLYVEIYYK